jgi:hypothetical protein
VAGIALVEEVRVFGEDVRDAFGVLWRARVLAHIKPVKRALGALLELGLA